MASHSFPRALVHFALAALAGVAVLCPMESALAGPESPRAPKAAVTKVDLLTTLKAIQTRQSGQLEELDDGVKKRLVESTKVTLESADLKLADRRITKLGGQVDDLVRRRAEFTVRRDLLSNLIFAFDTKWSGQPVAQFLEHTFLDMAMTDITDSKGEGKLWKFLIYASIMVREIPDPREDALLVFENYLNFANVMDPKTPALFLANRSYTSGNLSYSAKPVSRDRVGDFIEKSNTRMIDPERAREKTEKDAADIQLTLRPVSPPPTADDSGTSVSATTSRGDSAAATPSPANSDAPPAAPTPTPKPAAPSQAAPAKAQGHKAPRNQPVIDPTNGASIPPVPPPVPGEKY